jgi:predicted nucleic acid-binding protein
MGVEPTTFALRRTRSACRLSISSSESRVSDGKSPHSCTCVHIDGGTRTGTRCGNADKYRPGPPGTAAGFSKPKANQQIIERFRSLPLIVPNRDNHVDAAKLRIKCRRRGVQAGTIDARLAQLCIRHELTMLTTNKDFHAIGRIVPLTVWSG